MKVTKRYLERRIEAINELLEAQPKHNLKRLKRQNRDFYIRKLVEMDDKNLKTIKI